MRPRFDLVLKMCSSLALVVAAGCATEPATGSAGEAEGRVSQAIEGPCGVSGDVLSVNTLTPAQIRLLTTLEAAQIVLAVQESASTDVTTVEQAFSRVDEQQIRRIILRDSFSGQFFTQFDYGAGGNTFGAIFFDGTIRRAAAIHDGFQEECGPVAFSADQSDIAPQCAGVAIYANATSLAALDAFLPIQVAQAIVASRTVSSFDSISSLVAVPGVGDARLQAILSAARTAGVVAPTCTGIFDRIAFSSFQATALVEQINELDAAQLRDILSFLTNFAVVDNLIAGQPFASVAEISATPGVGPEVLRALRNFAGEE